MRLYDPTNRTVIFDLDGTLFDISHRMHLIKPELAKMDQGFTPDWKAFFKSCADDAPIWNVIDIALAMKAAGFKIAFITGRSDEIKYETVVSIHKYLGWLEIEGDYTLHMRKEGDHRPDDILKKELLLKAFPTKQDLETIVGVFEDRKQVVEMYRSLGLRVFQVDEGNF